MYSFNLPNSDKNINLLVLDIDDTVLGVRKQDKKAFLSKACPHQLSPDIIEHARNGNYHGIVICTHRSLATDKLCIQNNWAQIELARNIMITLQARAEKEHQPFEEYTKLNHLYQKACEFSDMTDLQMSDAFITSIIKNLEEETALKCLVVSTPDDVDVTCGVGFENSLKPYELNALATMQIMTEEDGRSKTVCHFPINKKQPFNFDYDHNSKNHQLMQISQWAIKRFPGNPIILDFIDDMDNIIKNATLLDSKTLPSNVTLNVHQHSIFEGIPITFKGTVQGSQEDVSHKKSVLQSSIFSLANNAQTTHARNHTDHDASCLPLIDPAYCNLI